MTSPKPAKTYYNEAEAAQELGITVEQLRSLIRRHVVEREEDLSNVSVATFQRSDLLLLRLLAGQQPHSTAPR